MPLPAVAGRGRLQPIERFRRHQNGGVVSDGNFRQPKIVVDRLRDADQIQAAFLRQRAQDLQAAVASDTDQRIEPGFEAALEDSLAPRTARGE